jgi:hypothetical protein
LKKHFNLGQKLSYQNILYYAYVLPIITTTFAS